MSHQLLCDNCGVTSVPRLHFGGDWWEGLHFALGVKNVNGLHGTVDFCSEACLRAWIEEKLSAYLKERKLE